MSATNLNRSQRRQAQRYLQEQAQQWPEIMTGIPESLWPDTFRKSRSRPVSVWRSRDFLACVYSDPNGFTRLSIQRTAIRRSGEWIDGLTWDDLQQVKRQIGFAQSWCVEVFPPEEHVVNVANLRHLWVLPEQPAFCWSQAASR